MSDKMKICYVIEKPKQPGGKSFWHRIGVAFVNQDGSLNVKLQAFPVHGEMQIRDYVPREGTVPSTAASSPLGDPPSDDNIPF